MKSACLTCVFSSILAVSGCASSPSTRVLREQIADLGNAALTTDDVQVERIIAQTDDRAVAETTVKLAFEYARNAEGTWEIVSLRLGDGRWVELSGLLEAVAALETDQTRESMEKLVDGVTAYMATNGALPEVATTGFLSDILHPLFMTELVRDDAWGARILYEVEPTGYRLHSAGPDRVFGSADDIVIRRSGP